MATVTDLTPNGKTLTFIDVLKHEVSRMQAAHPEREGAIARASALITLGMVTPSPDDPAIGLVLSSDNQTTYHVNGTCDCSAGQHGKDCKHVHGWKLYQYVARKLDAQTPQDATSAFQTTGGHVYCPGYAYGPARGPSERDSAPDDRGTGRHVYHAGS